jgi:hypothetical protein
MRRRIASVAIIVGMFLSISSLPAWAYSGGGLGPMIVCMKDNVAAGNPQAALDC